MASTDISGFEAKGIDGRKVEVDSAQGHPLHPWLVADAPGLLGSKATKCCAPQHAPYGPTADIGAALAG